MANANILTKTSAPLSLMIVEDDHVTSAIAAAYLKQFGTVITTSNPQEAVANYAVHHPDVVFLDINYLHADTDGFDVLKNLLSADERAYVIMISGDQDAETAKKAARSGAKGFITKPFRAIDFSYFLGQFLAAKNQD